MSRAQGVKALRDEAREWVEFARQTAQTRMWWWATLPTSSMAVRYRGHQKLDGKRVASDLEHVRPVRILRALFLSLECADEAKALAKSAKRGGAA